MLLVGAILHLTIQCFHFKDVCGEGVIAVVMYDMNAPISIASKHADAFVASNVLIAAVRFDLSRVIKAGSSCPKCGLPFYCSFMASSWLVSSVVPKKMLYSMIFLPTIFVSFATSLPGNMTDFLADSNNSLVAIDSSPSTITVPQNETLASEIEELEYEVPDTKSLRLHHNQQKRSAQPRDIPPSHHYYLIPAAASHHPLRRWAPPSARQPLPN